MLAKDAKTAGHRSAVRNHPLQPRQSRELGTDARGERGEACEAEEGALQPALCILTMPRAGVLTSCKQSKTKHHVGDY